MFPNDVVVVDQDGAVLIPQALLADVVQASVEQERLENWIMGEVEAGASLPASVCAGALFSNRVASTM